MLKIIDMLIQSDTKYTIENPESNIWLVIINPDSSYPVTMKFNNSELLHIEG